MTDLRLWVTSTYTYSSDHRSLSVTTGSFSHTYAYNAMGQLSGETNGEGSSMSYSYDAAGRLVAKTDYAGILTQYSYTPTGKMQTVRVNGVVQKSYTYDARGALTSAQTGDSSVAFVYDDFGRLVSQSENAKEVFRYTYDGFGRLSTRLRLQTGASLVYTWGNNGELVKLKDESGYVTSFVYDDAGRLVRQSSTSGNQVQKQYDSMGRLVAITSYSSSSGGYSPSFGEAYVYNKANQVVATVALDGTLKLYGYDDAGRLSSAQYAWDSSKPERDKQALEQTGVTPANLSRYFASYDLDGVDRSLIDQAYALAGGTSRTGVHYTANAWAEQFGYDSAGNRSSVTNPYGTISNLYDADNRLVQSGAKTYSYDANGNATMETLGTTATSSTYSFDNRVVSVTNGSGNVRYTYDALGRRNSRTAQVDGSLSTEQYSYEGQGRTITSVAQETTTSTPDLVKVPQSAGGDRYRPAPSSGAGTSGGTRTVTGYRSFSNIGSTVLSESGSSGYRSYTVDRLGSVREVSSDSGTDTIYDYDAFGQSMGATDPELLGYNGKVIDPVTGNYDYGYRDYAPNLARFTTTDPIQDGSNWYAYVDQDPVNLVDPTGLEVDATFHVTYVGGNRYGGTTAYGYITVVDNTSGSSYRFDNVRSGGMGTTSDELTSHPIPLGSYDILGKTETPNAEGQDLYNRLEARDGSYGDDVASFRGQPSADNLRIHGTGFGKNEGCISMTDQDASTFAEILQRTSTSEVQVKSKHVWGLAGALGFTDTEKKYGTITVIDERTPKR